MTHYQKIVAVIFRIIGTLIFIVSLLLLILSLLISLPSTNLVMIFITFLPCLIVSAVSFGLSRILAKLVCYDLGDFDGQK